MLRVTAQEVGQVLSVVFPITVAISVYLCGKRKKIGWLVGLLAQGTCGAFGVVTGFWGWVLGPMIIGPVFAWNWIKWNREDRERAQQRDAAAVAESTHR
jgi:hypothetical protein